MKPERSEHAYSSLDLLLLLEEPNHQGLKKNVLLAAGRVRGVVQREVGRREVGTNGSLWSYPVWGLGRCSAACFGFNFLPFPALRATWASIILTVSRHRVFWQKGLDVL